jgi:hypothetical protein
VKRVYLRSAGMHESYNRTYDSEASACSRIQAQTSRLDPVCSSSSGCPRNGLHAGILLIKRKPTLGRMNPCARAVVLNDGRIIREGTPARAQRDHAIISFGFLGTISALGLLALQEKPFCTLRGLTICLSRRRILAVMTGVSDEPTTSFT